MKGRISVWASPRASLVSPTPVPHSPSRPCGARRVMTLQVQRHARIAPKPFSSQCTMQKKLVFPSDSPSESRRKSSQQRILSPIPDGRIKEPLHVVSRSTHPDETPEDSDDLEYEVEAILDRRTRRGITEYFLKWKGYADAYNTWEPIDNLACHEMVMAFEEGRHLDKRQKTIPSEYTKSTPSKGSTSGSRTLHSGASSPVSNGSSSSSSRNQLELKTPSSKPKSSMVCVFGCLGMIQNECIFFV